MESTLMDTLEDYVWFKRQCENDGLTDVECIRLYNGVQNKLALNEIKDLLSERLSYD